MEGQWGQKPLVSLSSVRPWGGAAGGCLGGAPAPPFFSWFPHLLTAGPHVLDRGSAWGADESDPNGQGPLAGACSHLPTPDAHFTWFPFSLYSRSMTAPGLPRRAGCSAFWFSQAALHAVLLSTNQGRSLGNRALSRPMWSAGAVEGSDKESGGHCPGWRWARAGVGDVAQTGNEEELVEAWAGARPGG